MQTHSSRLSFLSLGSEDAAVTRWGAEECAPEQELFPRTALISANWEEVMPSLLQNWAQTMLTTWQDVSRIEVLAKELLLVKRRLTALEDAVQVTVPVESLAPEPFEVLRPINAVVRRRDDEYVATFYDANLNASGETETEAVVNLKDIIVTTFELLVSHSPEALSPGALHQKDVLQTFVRQCD